MRIERTTRSFTLIKKYLFLVLIFSFFITSQVLADGINVDSMAPQPLTEAYNGQIMSVISRESTIEEKVLGEFPDNPRMVDVIRCESHFKQFKNSKPLLSGTSDVGVMQINQTHWKEAVDLGLDIFNSVDDNIAMGRIIYNEQGINAWTCNKLV